MNGRKNRANLPTGNKCAELSDARATKADPPSIRIRKIGARQKAKGRLLFVPRYQPDVLSRGERASRIVLRCFFVTQDVFYVSASKSLNSARILSVRRLAELDSCT